MFTKELNHGSFIQLFPASKVTSPGTMIIKLYSLECIWLLHNWICGLSTNVLAFILVLSAYNLAVSNALSYADFYNFYSVFERTSLA